MNLSGDNGSENLSGSGDDNPDHERRESVKDHTGVVHGNRGRPSKRKVTESTVQRVVEFAGGKYRGFNDHHLTEKLSEEHKIKLSREKVIQQALCSKKRRTVAKDNTMTFNGTVFQIPKRSPFGSHAHHRIDVHVFLDGAVRGYLQDRETRRLRFENFAHTWLSNENQQGGVSLWTDFFAQRSTQTITLTFSRRC